MGPIWDVLGTHLGRLGAYLERHESDLGLLGIGLWRLGPMIFVQRAPSETHLGRFRSALGVSCGVLGRLGSFLELVAVLGTHLGLLEADLGRLWPALGVLGSMLGASGEIFC